MIREHHDFSPSTLPRLMECPGSYALCKTLPPVPENSDAAEGTAMHKAMETGIIPDSFTEEQKETVQRCMDCLEVIAGPGATIIKEPKMYLYDVDGSEINYGYADDVIITADNRLIVDDWKFGRNPVEFAKDNIQLACLAAMAMQAHGINKCIAYPIQPRCGRFEDYYTFTQLDAIVLSIKNIIRRCLAPDAEFCDGKHCTYCPALFWGKCPLAKSTALETAATAISVADKLEVMNPVELETLYRAGKTVEKLQAKVKDRIKEVCAESGSCGSLTLKETSNGVECTDILQAYKLVSEHMTQAEFLGCCNLSVSQLSKVFAKKMKDAGAVKSAWEGEKMLKERLESVLVEKDKKIQIVEEKQ